MLTGGLAGAALTLIVQALIRWWTRPQIEIVFANKEPGCLVDTNIPGGTKDVYRYIRIKVKNTGNSTAFGVFLCTTKLSFISTGTGSRAFRDEVFDLGVVGKQAPFLLAPGAHRYVDLGHTFLNEANGTTSFDYAFKDWRPARLERLGIGTQSGTYKMEIFVSAENAKSVQGIAEWSWDGGFPGLDIKGIVVKHRRRGKVQ